MTTNPMRRRSERRFTIGVAQVAGPNGWNSVFCTICDISDTGAQIEIPPDYKFPPTFTFKHVATNRERPARLVWRRYTLAGIEFTD